MSFRLTPTVAAALRAGQSPIVPMVEILLPGYALRHIVGAGELMWGGNRYVGLDPRYGVLVAAGNLHDGVSDEAPDWPLTFVPPDGAAIAGLAAAEAQGSIVNAWIGVVDRATGQVLPDPIQVFAGEIDVPRLRLGKGARTVEIRCASVLERFHDSETGARLSDAWHRSVWPGETGLANMSGIEKTSYWGVENVPSAVTYSSGGAGIGGRVAKNWTDYE